MGDGKATGGGGNSPAALGAAPQPSIRVYPRTVHSDDVPRYTLLSLDAAVQYVRSNHLDKPVRDHVCHFCDSQIRVERGSKPEDGLYAEEVGEFWSVSMQQSVLGHPDCVPYGIDAVFEGDPECDWKLA